MYNSYEAEEKKRGGMSRSFITVLILFTLFTILYTVFALLSPGKKIAYINSEYALQNPENSEPESSILSDSSFIALTREKAWLQARITMAETDSISLSLDLPDSLAVLEINGVAVFTSKLSSYRVSKVFGKADANAVSAILSLPFTIKSDISSIEKEPLMHKIAPRDTSEYKPAEIPDTSKVESVNFILETDNGFRIYFYQEPDEEKGTLLSSLLFDLTDRIRNSFHITKNLFLLKVPDYKPYIRVILPRGDARIIYRALPVNGQVAVRL